MRTRAAVAVVLGLLVAGHALGAQSDASGSRNPTIVLRAEVSAREVTFAKQPEIRVTLVGGTLDSVRVLERRNLPDRIVPGTTYRDVYIAVEVIGRVHAECLAAALTGKHLVTAILDDINTGKATTKTWRPGGCTPVSGSVQGEGGARRDTTRSP